MFDVFSKKGWTKKAVTFKEGPEVLGWIVSTNTVLTVQPSTSDPSLKVTAFFVWCHAHVCTAMLLAQQKQCMQLVSHSRRWMSTLCMPKTYEVLSKQHHLSYL